MTDRALCRAGVASTFAIVVASFAWVAPARALDLDVSGFGTLGYAQSNRSYTYDRYIDDRGTFMRDSVAGLQLDAKIVDGFGATMQVKVAPATDKDSAVEASVSWAFLSYRPNNDWLIRVGKQRIPYYLYSETFDVGASYDFARLPSEMYSISPSNDFTGLAIGRTFRLGNGELSVDGYWGRSLNDFRGYARIEIPGVQTAGPQFRQLNIKGGGFIVTYKDDTNQFRAGFARAVVREKHNQPFPSDYPFVSLAPEIGYYQVSDALPGPGIGTANSVTNTLFVVGADVALPAKARLVAEFARTITQHTPFAPHGNRGYAALLRPVGDWTPYVSYAFLRSPDNQRATYTRLNDSSVPPFIPGAAPINLSQRVGADQIVAFQQSSWAFGTSYSVTPSSKLKAEWMRTRVGEVSQLIDAGPGDTPRHLKLNTWSLSYSVVFQ